ncbi:MAG TPA: c-type cytochrome [Terriglobales bacterium]|nr:c-type cytochrome [Terriglobales bacterium]
MRNTYLIAAAVIALGAAAVCQSNPAEKTAEQEFKNIQVFQGKPANELIPTMNFMASSLGVECTFCHAAPFSADTKPQKATARKMIQMVFAINKDNFGGRNQINCFTCHQGHSRPTSTLSIAADAGAAPAAPAPPAAPGGAKPELPTAQQILDKYQAALGGAAALAGIKSETVTATRVAGDNSAPESVVRADGKLLITDERGGNKIKSGFDGSSYWNGTAGPARSDAQATLAADVPLYPGADLKAEGARVFGEAPIDGKPAYLLAVRGPGGAARYYFDKDSGLLVREVTGAPTYLGALPLQVDFSDYQTVDGVKLPFDTKWSDHTRTWERKVSAIKLNAPVDAAEFVPPPAKQ